VHILLPLRCLSHARTQYDIQRIKIPSITLPRSFCYTRIPGERIAYRFTFPILDCATCLHGITADRAVGYNGL
jgi:hypothetical protein